MSDMDGVLILLNKELFPELSKISRMCGILRQDIYRNTSKGKLEKKTQGGGGLGGGLGEKSLGARITADIKEREEKKKKAKSSEGVSSSVNPYSTVGIRRRKGRSKSPRRRPSSRSPIRPIKPVYNQSQSDSSLQRHLSTAIEGIVEHCTQESERMSLLGTPTTAAGAAQEKLARIALERTSAEIQAMRSENRELHFTTHEGQDTAAADRKDIMKEIKGVGHQVEKARRDLANRIDSISDQMRGSEGCKEEYIKNYVHSLKKAAKDAKQNLKHKNDEEFKKLLESSEKPKESISWTERKRRSREAMLKYAKEIRDKRKEFVIETEIDGEETELEVRKTLYIQKHIEHKGDIDLEDIPWWRQLFYSFMCWMSIITTVIRLIGSVVNWCLSIGKALLFFMPTTVASPLLVCPCLGTFFYYIAFTFVLLAEIILIYHLGGGSLVRGPLRMAMYSIGKVFTGFKYSMGFFKESLMEFKEDLKEAYNEFIAPIIHDDWEYIKLWLYCCLPASVRNALEGNWFGSKDTCSQWETGAIKKRRKTKKKKTSKKKTTKKKTSKRKKKRTGRSKRRTRR